MDPLANRLPRVAAFSEQRIPSAILGVDQVLEFLASRGVCEFRACSSMHPRVEDLVWADSLIFVRGASPQEVRIQQEALRLGKRTACYLDDDLESVPAEAVSGLFYGMPSIRNGIQSMIAHANLVLVTQEFLGQTLAQRYGRPTTILRQPRPPRLAPRTDDPETKNSSIRVGFLGSLDHHTFLEGLLEGPARKLRQEFGDQVQFVFCGVHPEFATSIKAEVLPYEMDFHSWRRKAASLAIDIGLAPLPVSDFHRSKYWNKYLEYASLAIPGIYSEGSPNAQVVEHDRTGLIVPNQPDAWEAAMRKLITDAELRKTMATNASNDVEARFSEQALNVQWQEAIRELLDHRAPASSPDACQLPTGPWRHWLDRFSVYGVRNTLKMARRRIARRPE